jgi:hypothetical protein
MNYRFVDACIIHEFCSTRFNAPFCDVTAHKANIICDESNTTHSDKSQRKYEQPTISNVLVASRLKYVLGKTHGAPPSELFKLTNLTQIAVSAL